MRLNSVNYNFFNNPFLNHEVNKKSDIPSDFAQAKLSFWGATGAEGSKMRKGLRGLNCPCCGIKMLYNRDLNRALALPPDAPSKDVIAVLNNYKDNMHETENNVFYMLKYLSKRYPKENLRQLLDKVRPRHLDMLLDEEKRVIGRIRAVGSFLNETEQEKLDNTLFEAEAFLKGDYDNVFARRVFIGKIGDVTSNFEEKDIADTIFEISHELPRAGTSVSAFIVKFSQKNPKTGVERNSHDIIKGLLLPSMATVEHVKARSPLAPNGGGENKLSNYILECARDNNMRECMPFRDFVKKHPKFFGQHLQRYIDAIIAKLNRGELQGFENYPLQISRTLRRQTKGQIKLDISKLNSIKDKDKNIT